MMTSPEQIPDVNGVAEYERQCMELLLLQEEHESRIRQTNILAKVFTVMSPDVRRNFDGSTMWRVMVISQDSYVHPIGMLASSVVGLKLSAYNYPDYVDLPCESQCVVGKFNYRSGTIYPMQDFDAEDVRLVAELANGLRNRKQGGSLPLLDLMIGEIEPPKPA